jgi:hypothetical protein
VKPDAVGGIQTQKPIAYGTAFPIAPGVFATAAHVVHDADVDGEPVLAVVSGAGGTKIRPYRIEQFEQVKAIDLGLLYCSTLRHLPPMPLDFDRPLGMLARVTAIGFPFALDAEYVTVVPRGFGGHVVTRRELYHLPGQPPGYEVSFCAPQGLSGAPLISMAFGEPRCYGYIVQQSTIGTAEALMPAGIAVGIEAVLSVMSKDGEHLAHLFGREFRPFAATPRRSAQFVLPDDLDTGWPDDDLPPSDK